MKEAELVNKLQQWESYLHQFSSLDLFQNVASFFKTMIWYLIIGLAQILDAMNGMASKALVLLNIYDSPAFRELMKKYLPLFIAIGIIFAGATLIGMMTNRGKDQTLYDFYRNLFIAMIVIIGFPWVWGQATNTTAQVAKYINQSTSMSTNIISKNVTDLYYIDSKYKFDVSSFNSKSEGTNKAGLGEDKEKNYLPKDKNGNIKVSDLSRIKPSETIDTEKSAIDLSKDGKEILSHQIQWSGKTAKAEELGKGFMGFGATHYSRYKINTFRILFYLLMGIIVSAILTWKVAQISYEVWYNGALVQGAAFFDLKTGKRLIALTQKFFISLGAILVIFVMQTLFNIGYAYVDASVETTDLKGFLLNCILKVALLLTIIDGPNAFESVFGVDAGLKSATRSIIAMNQGSQLIQSGMNKLGDVSKFAARNAARGGGFIAGSLFGAKSSPEEADAMNGIGSEHKDHNGTSQDQSTGAEFGQGEHSSTTGEDTSSKGTENKADENTTGQKSSEFQNASTKNSESSSAEEKDGEKSSTNSPSDENSPFKTDDFDDKVEKANEQVDTHGLSSDYSDLLNGQNEEAVRAFDEVTLPHAVTDTVESNRKKVDEAMLAYENAEDKYRGIKQQESQEVKSNLKEIVTPTQKGIKNATLKGYQAGETAKIAMGWSSERKQAKQELKQAKQPFKADGLFSQEPRGDMFNGD
ncbi:pLS20_p028 family conjugation system transmembrane protein [Lactococcus petauri]|nr:hypothetical protein [Lactococcus petauri]